VAHQLQGCAKLTRAKREVNTQVTLRDIFDHFGTNSSMIVPGLSFGFQRGKNVIVNLPAL
jgi:hypothetical protein